MKLATLFALLALAGTGIAQSWNYDAAHSSVAFSIKHLAVSTTKGEFDKVDIKLSGDARKPSTLSAEVTIQTASVNTKNEKRDEHLRAPDFFDAAKYPTITFKSNMVHDMGGGKLMIMGDLTVHGVTRPVTLDATLNKAAFNPMFKADVIGFDATATIKRSDFGVGAYVPNVGDEIAIRITTEAQAAAAK